MKGIRVIDLTSVLSGPFCTWLLASLGAEVIKVESPAGDMARSTPPFTGDGQSIYFASLNRNKRSIVLDLKSAGGVGALHRLLATADVFIENMRPGVRARLGCDDESLSRLNRRLVRASITGFGQSGSLAGKPAYDIVVQAMSGVMSVNGPLGGPPTRVGFSVGDIAAALFCTVGILERLYRRAACEGDHDEWVDVSMLACQWACLEIAFARYLNAGIVARPLGSRHPSIAPFETYSAADGDIAVALGGDKDWGPFCAAIAWPELEDDPRFTDNERRLENRDALSGLLSKHFSCRTADYWLEQLERASIPCAPVNDVRAVAEGEMAREYAAFSSVEAAGGASMQFVRSPLAGEDLHERAAPRLGEHTEQILRELGYEQADIDRLIEGDAGDRRG